MKEKTWDDIIEEFNVEVADKELFFVTATQLAKWLKKKYPKPPKPLTAGLAGR